MLPYLADVYANPSGSHRFARRARRAIDESPRRRRRGARRPTERGGVHRMRDRERQHGDPRSSPSHAAVSPCARLPNTMPSSTSSNRSAAPSCRSTGSPASTSRPWQRCSIEHAPPVESVAVVSVMAVNNEVGTVTDIAAAAEVVRRHAPGALFHTDAVQAPSWLDLRDITPHVDLLALSAHKFGGPKGVGVLVERGGPRIDPLIIGGGQERERRSGTHNVAGHRGCRHGPAAHRHRTGHRDPTAHRSARPTGRRTRRTARRRARDHPAERERAGVEKVAGSAHVCIGGVESEALLYPARRGGCVRIGGLCVCERGDGTVACAGSDGRRPRRRARRAPAQPRTCDDRRRRRTRDRRDQLGGHPSAQPQRRVVATGQSADWTTTGVLPPQSPPARDRSWQIVSRVMNRMPHWRVITGRS